MDENPLKEGISVDLVDTDSTTLTESFICVICLNLVLNPVFCEESDCVYCKNCIEAWSKKDANCPNCRKEFKPNTKVSRILKNMLLKIKLKCLYTGCKEITEYEKYEYHLNKCDFAMYKCMVKGCDYKSPKKEILDHLQNCKFFEINCEFCSKKTFKSSLKEHYLICPKFNKFCPVCKAFIENLEMSTHQNGSCFETLAKLFLSNSHLNESENYNLLTDYDETKNTNSVLLQKIKILNEEILRIKDESDKKDIKINDLLSDVLKIKKDFINQSKYLQIGSNINNSVELQNHRPVICQHDFEFLQHSLFSKCGKCDKEVSCRFKCRKCMIAFCYKCNRPKDKFKCPSGHIFAKINRNLPFNCDICFEFYNENSISMCDLECDIDICVKCQEGKECLIF